MTVDVEDYFHASAFDRVVSRPVVDRAREPRGAATPHRLLELLRSSTASARTFFVLGWVAERFPAAGARHRRRAATRSRRTATTIS